MTDDDGTVDTTELPAVDVPAPEDVLAEIGPVEADESGADDAVATDRGYEFCVLFAGRPWMPAPLQASSAGEAVASIRAIVAFYNRALVAAGYPDGICTWSYGPCPSGGLG